MTTPAELLEQVKSQYQVVYLDDTALKNLLKQALGTYQDKVGEIKEATLDKGASELSIPADFLEIISVEDAQGRWHEVSLSSTTITVVPQRKSVRPYSIKYFADLSAMDLDKDDLPAKSIGILTEYLKALIDIPNVKRERQIATATGIQAEYPSDEELRARKENLELTMEDVHSIIPMTTVY